MKRARLLSSKVQMDDGFLRVTFDRAIDPEGREIGRAIVQHEGSAVILPVNAKGEVLLERIFRLPAGQYLWELPAGRIDPGEKPLAAARRELKEETGLAARRWKKLVEFYASPGFLAEKMTIYLAEDLHASDAEASDDEPMQLRWFKRPELMAAVASNRFRDAKTLLGIRMWLEASGRQSSKPGKRASSGRPHRDG